MYIDLAKAQEIPEGDDAEQNIGKWVNGSVMQVYIIIIICTNTFHYSLHYLSM
jgi:hypothetical protein